MGSDVEVTIGLCVKNAESTIKEAVDSTIDQDFPHELIELIVVDGYSGDKTLEIIKNRVLKTDVRFRIIQDSKGLGAARQIVVAQSKGKYVVWVDADMKLSKDFVRKQVEFMERNPKAGIAKGRYGVYDKAGLVAILENTEFVVDSYLYEGEVTSSLALGTSGCIYRVEAIKQVKGFDQNIKGVGEDMDAEYRIKAAGWSLHISNAVFCEKRRESWRSLWSEYFWHGTGARDLFQKNKKLINFRMMLPPVAVFTELRRSVFAYKLTARKVVFLLPFHWIFKRAAWLLGFVSASV
jgi:glycosyltransferase involved in cell wall biosynthesis